MYPKEAVTNINDTDLKHYENKHMHYAVIAASVKNDNFTLKNLDIHLFLIQKIDCGNTLDPHEQGGSNEYPQIIFGLKISKII